MDGQIETRIARFLLAYRIAPQSMTRLSPENLFLGRCPHTKFDLVHPDIYKKVHDKEKKVSTSKHSVWKYIIGDTLCKELFWSA